MRAKKALEVWCIASGHTHTHTHTNIELLSFQPGVYSGIYIRVIVIKLAQRDARYNCLSGSLSVGVDLCLFSCCFVFLCVYVCVCRGGFYYANKVRNSSDLPNTFLLLIPSSSSPSFFYSLSLSLLLSLSLSLTDMHAHTHFLTKQEQSLLKANAHLVPYSYSSVTLSFCITSLFVINLHQVICTQTLLSSRLSCPKESEFCSIQQLFSVFTILHRLQLGH